MEPALGAVALALTVVLVLTRFCIVASVPVALLAIGNFPLDTFQTSYQTIKNWNSLSDLASFNGLTLNLLICAFAIAVCFIGSVITGNNSQVDRLWSIIPAVYAWVFAWQAGFPTRSILMAVLISLWAVRLTFNFWRKGGFQVGSEDYRWPILRKLLGKPMFQLFNFTFIATYQNVLIFLFTLPCIAAALSTQALNWLDAVATALFLAFLLMETIADEQQWAFYAKREELAKSGAARTGDFKRGFNTQGLFRYSRHPNFFAEQAIWFCVWLFSVSSIGDFMYTLHGWMTACGLGLGFFLLVLLFQGSAPFTEAQTLKKYPSYAAYQAITPRMWPSLRPRPAFLEDICD